ncbi:amino acid transporter LysE [Actibacterium mucosum KCTC 23349]|uniref:Amino acid transporter LysE n=1 Tax=Actibacterium mucosum KCTC 23349 TaxID=1454373 RepID=A0A037ZJU4_9RHOB|nr:LysE family translocator [Actibacterium mucosum]KAJ56715.1 amino acid transporter LysE [Actibacterium mucosum KCTC 23349]
MSVAVASFLTFAASQVGTPGPANMALMATGARFGLRRALPFVAGVALGKQLVIWPLGLGLLALSHQVPVVFDLLKWVSAAYICWLAIRIAGMRLAPGAPASDAPGFGAGLAVHPLNPKAWAMITAGFTNFVSPGTPALQATAIIAICLLATQIVLHPVYTFAGERLAGAVAGKPAERYLMLALAALTVASVGYVLFGGGKA